MEIGVTNHADSLQLRGSYPPVKYFGRSVINEEHQSTGLQGGKKSRRGPTPGSRRTLRPRTKGSSESTLTEKPQGIGTYIIHVPGDGEQDRRDAQRQFQESYRTQPFRHVIHTDGISETPYRFPATVTVKESDNRKWEPAASTVSSSTHSDLDMGQEEKVPTTLPIIQQRRRLLAIQKNRHRNVSQDDNPEKPTTPGLYGQGIEALQHYCVSKRPKAYVTPTTKISYTTRQKPNNLGSNLPEDGDENSKGRLPRKCASLPSIHAVNFEAVNSMPSLRHKPKGDVSLPDLSARIKFPDLHKRHGYGDMIRTARSEPPRIEDNEDDDDLNYNELGSTSRSKHGKAYSLRHMTVSHHRRMIDSQVSTTDKNIKVWVDKIKDNNVVVDNSMYEMYARKPVSKYSTSKVTVTMAMSNVANRAYRLKAMLDGLGTDTEVQNTSEANEEKENQEVEEYCENIECEEMPVNFEPESRPVSELSNANDCLPGDITINDESAINIVESEVLDDATDNEEMGYL